MDTDGKPISIGFRYPNGDYQVRRLDQKDFYWVKGNSKDPHGLFGRDKFAEGSHKYVIVTEGALDAQSMWQTLQIPSVSVVSATTAVTDCRVDRSYLNSYERIYLCFDADAPGREATAAVARLFDYDKLWQVKFTTRKDANEYVQAQEVEELRNIFWNSRKYLPESILSTQEEFDGVLSEEPKPGVAYPFNKVTEKTKGIRRGESVLITAQEGIGKTELMHAIEYGILSNTEDNVGAIFLEELPRRHLQALAGIRLKKAVHLPNSGCSTVEVREALREVVGKDDRLYVYRNFGSCDTEILLDTIRFLVSGRSCNYILVDHFSMAAGSSAAEDERRKLEYLADKLENMVKELNYALIIVSHVNDFGQTRGSRYISKIADIRIDVTRDILSQDDVVRRTINFSISKNRPAWETGYAGSYVFDPMTNTYEETENVSGYPGSGSSLPFIDSPSITPGEVVGNHEHELGV